MNVRELQEILSGMYPEDEVKVSYDASSVMSVREYDVKLSGKYGCVVLRMNLPGYDAATKYLNGDRAPKDTKTIYGKKKGRPRKYTEEEKRKVMKAKWHYYTNIKTLTRINEKRIACGEKGWTLEEIKQRAKEDRVKYYYTKEEYAAMKLNPNKRGPGRKPAKKENV